VWLRGCAWASSSNRTVARRARAMHTPRFQLSHSFCTHTHTPKHQRRAVTHTHTTGACREHQPGVSEQHDAPGRVRAPAGAWRDNARLWVLCAPPTVRVACACHDLPPQHHSHQHTHTHTHTHCAAALLAPLYVVYHRRR
jgi:hypothetical protein